jgi:CubicO group peptidase (beta-lactamase class C family)
VIERVSGKPYDAYLQENIFRPLALKHTGYEKEGDGVANRAQGYVKGPLGMEQAAPVHMSVPYAAGGLYSTPEDLKRWNQLLHGGKVLSPQSLRAMTTPTRTGSGTAWSSTGTKTGSVSTTGAASTALKATCRTSPTTKCTSS